VAPGNYSWLLLQHEKFFVTPVYSANHQKKNWLRIEPGRNQDLHFDVHRKVAVGGRVIDAATRKPVRGMSVRGELAHGTPAGWTDRPPGQWSFAGWAETDAQGRYTLDVAAGSVRIACQGNELVSEQDDYPVTVAEDGPSVIGDIKVSPLQKVVGVVQNPDGAPAARAVVRLRGKFMNGIQPVLTDAAGRFEIQPVYLPVDEDTGKRLVDQHVVAFDPYRPLAARAQVRLDQPKEVLLKLEPHAADWPVATLESDLSDWERGNLPPDRAANILRRSTASCG
jgi:hypothetical protein